MKQHSDRDIWGGGGGRMGLGAHDQGATGCQVECAKSGVPNLPVMHPLPFPFPFPAQPDPATVNLVSHLLLALLAFRGIISTQPPTNSHRQRHSFSHLRQEKHSSISGLATLFICPRQSFNQSQPTFAARPWPPFSRLLESPHPHVEAISVLSVTTIANGICSHVTKNHTAKEEDLLTPAVANETIRKPLERFHRHTAASSQHNTTS